MWSPQNGFEMDEAVHEAMRPGDLLLSRGSENTAEWITFIGRCRYSHAALWTGQQIVETGTGSGVTLEELSSEMQDQWYVDVYRWHARDGGPALGDVGYPEGPVVDAAKRLVGKPFDTASSALLALIVAVSEIGGSRFGPMLRGAIGEVWKWVQKRKGPGEPQRAMICTESVCTAFSNAKKETKTDYGVIVEMAPSRLTRLQAHASRAPLGMTPRAMTPENLETLSNEDIQSLAAEIFLNATWSGPAVAAAVSELSRRAPGLGFAEATRQPLLEVGGLGLPECCVTPHDLETSPSFSFKGHLSRWVGVEPPEVCDPRGGS